MTDQRSLSLITILIVEDSEEDRATYSRYLLSDKDTTYHLLEAETVEDGLELWRSQSPDILLIDLNLPDGSGLDFLEAINVDREGEKIPAIMLTGHGSEKIAVRAMKLGASDYLLKGEINPKVLTTAVKQVFRESTLRQQLWQSQQQQNVITEISSRIREHFNLEDILNVTVKELREFIKADRVAIYQFNPDMSGLIISEDIGVSWESTLNVLVEDTCFRENLGGDYCNGKIFVANDIYAANLQDCHIQLLESFQVRANLVVPIRLPKDNKQFLWGLLIVHQCSAPRFWTELEIQLVQSLSMQLEIAIQQMISYQNLERELKNRKIAEQALQESEQMNRTIVETIPDLLIQMDRNGVYQYRSGCSGNVRVILPDPSVSELRIENILPKHLALAQVHYANLALDSGTVQIFEQIVDFEDERRYEEVRVAPIDDREVLMIIRDITDRKRTELILKKLLEGTATFTGEDFFPALVIHIAEALEVSYAFITELVDGKLHSLAFSANGELQPTFSYQPPSTPCEYVLNNDEYYCERDLQTIFPQDLDLVSLKAESYLGIALKDHRGNAIGHLCILDVKPLPSPKITEALSILKIFASRAAVELQRKRTNEELKQLNQSLESKVAERTKELWQVNKLQRAILDSANYSIIATDLNGIIQTFNTAAERMLGYSMDEVVGITTPAKFHDPQEIAERTAALSIELGKDVGHAVFTVKADLNIHQEQEWTSIRKDGSHFPTSILVTAIKDDEGRTIGYLGIGRDISDRKHIEKIEKLLKQQIAAIEAAIDGIAILQDSNYIYINQSHLEMFGYMYPEELLGKSWTELYSSEEIARFGQEVFPVLMRDRSWQGEAIATRKDGSTFDEGLSLTLTDDGLLICVCRDISDQQATLRERKKAEEQLKQANEELLKVTKLKDEFLANMSHELRTPLNSILGLSEGLRDQIFGLMNESQLKAISTVESSAEHLLSLINDILDLSKISSGMMELEIEPASVKVLCDSSLVFIKQKAHAKSLQIVTSIPMFMNDINVDIRRTKQILINLLSNAVKFTPNGGKVSLLVSFGSGDTWQGEATIPQQLKTKNSSMILFQVVDNGIGIDSNDLQRLFQPFVQVSGSLNRQHEGTGLGLALVKQIAELHGGQIIAESEVGKGSRFTVALPYDMSASNASLPTKVSTTLPLQPINLDKTNAPLILLAEDNEANIQTFTAYLSAINYRIVVARNGKDAIAQAKAISPDIIIMDIQMPEMDGLESIRLIRADSQLATIPIIALTALAMEGDSERCLAIGASKYLSKPIKLRTLASAVQQLCYELTNVV
ncbi:response regulator [Pseudanabaena yagii]|uniref:histidine kinase n=1 Tax=Pseudanabaena yagii GIHE-NHR1 TaxID=2722753 RepID=A0ABX1LTV7_9CYAN|nr:response regulator [Pseudanabaena yagii]NMF58723.1 response regulator [Pseudanabaena yagii GIHE-NHR1]